MWKNSEMKVEPYLSFQKEGIFYVNFVVEKRRERSGPRSIMMGVR
jgi:hypothetical protein